MARHQSTLVNWSQYLLARLAVMGLTACDLEANLRHAKAIGGAVYRLDRRHRQRTVEHLRIAFPGSSPQELERLARASFEHLLQLAVEVCHAPRLIHRDSWSKRLKLTNLAPATELFNSEKSAIVITGHLGNWEVLGYLLGVIGLRLHAIFRPLDNPLISDWLLGIRQRRGLQLITKWGNSQRMRDVLDGGGILGFVADQNAGDKGIFVPFFGRLASTYKSIGLLAMAQNVPIVCGYARRINQSFQYEIAVADIIYPDDWQLQPDPLYYITARYMRAIELMISECPQQYLWMHRRWKSRPPHERSGAVMPARLRKNIEQLPWMDQATLARIL